MEKGGNGEGAQKSFQRCVGDIESVGSQAPLPSSPLRSYAQRTLNKKKTLALVHIRTHTHTNWMKKGPPPLRRRERERARCQEIPTPAGDARVTGAHNPDIMGERENKRGEEKRTRPPSLSSAGSHSSFTLMCVAQVCERTCLVSLCVPPPPPVPRTTSASRIYRPAWVVRGWW